MDRGCCRTDCGYSLFYKRINHGQLDGNYQFYIQLRSSSIKLAPELVLMILIALIIILIFIPLALIYLP